MTSPANRLRQGGFTLTEMVMVIVITGILAGIVAVFIAGPVGGYVDSARRAQLTDAADAALRHLAREVRLALPNSMRVGTDGSNRYIEFIMTSAGGRYRDASDG
jgi:MSHA biogenesis protein MshO